MDLSKQGILYSEWQLGLQSQAEFYQLCPLKTSNWVTGFEPRTSAPKAYTQPLGCKVD